MWTFTTSCGSPAYLQTERRRNGRSGFAAFGSTDEADLSQHDVDCDGQINPVDSGIVQSLFGTCEEPRGECP